MKKQLTVALGLAVLATPAFATKARLQALGEDAYGSFYINDNRNIWLNAAQVNNHRDLVTFETGSTDVNADAAATPRAEGGVYKQAGNLVYGVHFGAASETANGLRLASGVTNGEENNIDAFVGGDAGLKWGANLGYAKAGSDETDGNSRQEALRTRLGVIAGDTQVYANISLLNTAKENVANGSDRFEGKLGYQVGAIQAWNGWSFNVDWRQFSGENDTDSTDIDAKMLLVQAGRVTRLNDRTNLFTRASLQWAKADNDASASDLGAGACTGINSQTGSIAGGLFCESYKTTRVPVAIGLENEATSWLALRASLVHTIWGTEEGETSERTVRNSTGVNLGASLKFGELAVDGVIGNASDVGAAGENTAAGNGVLRTDTLMTRVAATYRF